MNKHVYYYFLLLLLCGSTRIYGAAALAAGPLTGDSKEMAESKAVMVELKEVVAESKEVKKNEQKKLLSFRRLNTRDFRKDLLSLKYQEDYYYYHIEKLLYYLPRIGAGEGGKSFEMCKEVIVKCPFVALAAISVPIPKVPDATMPCISYLITGYGDRLWVTDLVDDMLKRCPSAVGSTDIFWATCLHYAAAVGNVDLGKMIIKHAQGYFTTRKQLSAFLDAQEAKSGATALHRAVKRGCWLFVQLLVDSGANATICDHKEISPLMLAQEMVNESEEESEHYAHFERMLNILEAAEKRWLRWRKKIDTACEDYAGLSSLFESMEIS